MNNLSRIETQSAAIEIERSPELSFVIPAKDEAKNIAQTINQIANISAELVDDYEVIVVDDGSSDGTFYSAKEMAQSFPVRCIRFSRNFGKEQAIMAGLQAARGRAVAILDADLQEPLHHLKTMIERYRQGYEMIYAVRADRSDETFLKRFSTKVFYHLLGAGTEFTIPRNARDFRLMDRRVVDTLCALPERNRFMKGLYGWVGFKNISVPIEISRRQHGTTKFRFGDLFRLGCTGITAFTTWPLRVWTLIGGMFALFSILYGSWIFVRTVFWGTDISGWSTLAVAIFFLGGIQLISIGVLGEYLSRVFTEVKGRPGFVIAKEFNPAPKL